ncbi:MAG: ABC transporter permease [Chloroflexota bacterium]
MTSSPTLLAEEGIDLDEAIATNRPTRRSLGRRLHLDTAAVVGWTIVIGVLAMALLAPLIAPFPPNDTDLRARLLPPGVLGGSASHVLGTDSLGRDVLSRVIWGSQLTLLVGVTAVLVGGLIGVTTGVVAGYAGGWWDLVVGRIADVQQAIPFVILALAVVAVVGASLLNLILVLGVGSWIFTYRIARAESLRVREQPYVEAARTLGAGTGRILRAHVLPNIAPPVIVVATLFVPQVIIYTAGLSFLGLGVPPPAAEWGRDIAQASEYLRTAPWPTLVPSAFLVVTVLGINLIGDWLRDVLDPVERSR